MSLQIERLTKEVLTSYANTRSFLEGRSTIVDIAKQRDLFVGQPLYFTAEYRNPNRFWRVLHALTCPIRFVLRAFLIGVGFYMIALTYIFPSLNSLRLRIHKLAKQLKIGFRNFGSTKIHTYELGPCQKEKSLAPTHPLPRLPRALTEKHWKTQVTLLGWSQNIVRKENRELATQAPIQVTDPRLKKRTFHKGHVEFKGGYCRGMSYWFLYLYFQTKHLYADARKQMFALSKIFRDGAPIEAMLLQGMYTRNGKIMNLCHNSEHHIGFHYLDNARKIELAEINGTRQIKDPTLAKKELTNLDVGAYICCFPTHAVVYIKVSQELSYFYNPNRWIMEVAGPHQGEHLFINLNKPKHFGVKGNHSSILLCPIQLRETAPHIGPN